MLLKTTDEQHCSLCGAEGPFAPPCPGGSLRETRCPVCHSSRRNRDIARVIVRFCKLDESRPLQEQVGELARYRIFELQARGVLHTLLNCLPLYECSEYFPHLASGEVSSEGILCQNATCLSFEDASFDIVISQDILEHIEDAPKALMEINRVLRPGGTHIFTVPIHDGRKTRQRAFTRDDGGIEHSLSPICHKDPLNSDGAFVWWDYGDDLAAYITSLGIPTQVALSALFYTPEQVCHVATQEAYEHYQKSVANRQIACFFLYNSYVFCARQSSEAR